MPGKMIATNALASSSSAASTNIYDYNNTKFTKPRSRRSIASPASSRASSVSKSRKNSLILVLDQEAFLPSRRASIAALPSPSLFMIATPTQQRYPLSPLNSQMQSSIDTPKRRQSDDPLSAFASALDTAAALSRFDAASTSSHPVIDYSSRRSSATSMNGSLPVKPLPNRASRQLPPSRNVHGVWPHDPASQPTYSSRRTSLPALHLGAIPPSSSDSTRPQLPSNSRLPFVPHSPPHSPSAPEAPRFDTSVYDHLNSFSFGQTRAPPSNDDSTTASDSGSAYIPPSPLASASRRPLPLNPQDDNDSESTDEEDLARRLERAKMRAIDDGGRRPSLPINIPPSARRANFDDRQFILEDSEMSSPDIKPLPDLPSSDPGPRRLSGQAAIAGFDLDFIMDFASLPSTSTAPPPEPSVNNTFSFEDTFTTFVDKYDEKYAERRGEWSFLPEAPSRVRTRSQTNSAGRVWTCGPVGKLLVSHEADTTVDPFAGPLPDNAIVIKHFNPPTTSPRIRSTRSQPASPTSPGSSKSDVRVHIHRHSRAPAFSLFLGAWNPREAARSSILLAPKSVHAHVSGPKNHKGHSSNGVGTKRPRGGSGGKPDVDRDPHARSLRSAPLSPDHGFKTAMMNAAESTPLPTWKPEGTVDFETRRPSAGSIMSVDKVSPSKKPHAIAFDTLSSHESEKMIELIRTRSTIGDRIKKAFLIPAGPSPKEKDTSGSLSRTPSNGPPLEGVYSPPWMLMNPGYIKSDRDRKVRRMNSSLSAAGFLPPNKEKDGPHRRRRSTKNAMEDIELHDVGHTISGEPLASKQPSLSHRTSFGDLLGRKSTSANEALSSSTTSDSHVLDEVPEGAMCMAVPLWDFRHERSQSDQPPSSAGRQWLLIYYVPFASPALNLDPPTTTSGKKRPRQAGRRSSAAANPPATPSISTHRPLQSFRVVARILSPTELRDSGLRYPATTFDEHLEDEKAEILPVVIGVCHDPRNGVEFIPEGLDRLGLCDEALPEPSFNPHMPERQCSGLTPVGKEVVEIAWAGCLALMEG